MIFSALHQAAREICVAEKMNRKRPRLQSFSSGTGAEAFLKRSR
jgi:hypothetical protein